MSKPVMVKVVTNLRSYVVAAGTVVAWEPDEEVVSIEVIEEA